jgi:hypothetical protein
MGDRLPTPPRERKPALAALAVLLILAGALGATMLVMQAGDRVEAVMVTERVPAGQPIPDSAIKSVLVAEDSAVHYVLWSQRGQLQEEYRPSVDLVAGTLLVGEMLTDEETLGRNEVFVGLSLSPNQYPAGLGAGDTVSAYWVGGTGDGSAEQPDVVMVERVKVQEISGSEGRNLRVTLRIDAADAPALTRAGANGDVSLVIVPAGDN